MAVRGRTSLLAMALVLLVPGVVRAQAVVQAAGVHSALVDVDGRPVKDDDFAAAVAAGLMPNGTPTVHSAAFIFQPCFGGGMLDDLKTALGKRIPWVAGSASSPTEPSWGQVTKAELPKLTERDEAKIKALETRLGELQALRATVPFPVPFTAVVAVARLDAAIAQLNVVIAQLKTQVAVAKAQAAKFTNEMPHFHWTRALVEVLSRQQEIALYEAMGRASFNDVVGANGSLAKMETGQRFRPQGQGDLTISSKTSDRLFLIMWAGQPDVMAFFHDVEEMRKAIVKRWNKPNKLEVTIFFGDGQKRADGKALPAEWNAKPAKGADLLAALRGLAGKMTKDDKLIFYATDHGMLVADTPVLQLGAANVPIRNGFNLRPEELQAMAGTLESAPVLTVHHDAITSPHLAVFVNGTVVGHLDEGSETTVLDVPTETLGGCNVVEIQSEEPSDTFEFHVGTAFTMSGLDPVFIPGVTPSPSATCPDMTLLQPFAAARETDDTHSVTLRLGFDDAGPRSGRSVTFTVVAGPNEGTTGTATTGSDGTATFSYAGDEPGVDAVEATLVNGFGQVQRSNLVQVTWSEPEEPVHCAFDTSGDGVADLDVPDVDDDGVCDFPTGKTHIVGGDLVFEAGPPIEFREQTVIEADTIIVEPGAELRGEAHRLRSLLMYSVTDDFTSDGVLSLSTDDDLHLRARGDLVLAGSPALGATDQVLLDARAGDVVVAPGTQADGFTVLAGNRITVSARGPSASIDLDGASLGSRRISVDGRSTTSQPGARMLRVGAGSALVTDPTRTGLRPGAGVIDVVTSGTLAVSGADLDAERSLQLAARQPVGDVCLEAGTRLEAADAAGRLGFIDLTGVRGRALDDGSTSITGILRGALGTGVCGDPPGTTTTTVVPGTTTTTVPSTTSRFRYYVQIARTGGSSVNVSVPLRGGEPGLEVAIDAAHLARFAPGQRVPGEDIAALGGETLARLQAAAASYLAAHPGDYPGFAGIVVVRWVARE